jgi:hypothetical protein
MTCSPLEHLGSCGLSLSRSRGGGKTGAEGEAEGGGYVERRGGYGQRPGEMRPVRRARVRGTPFALASALLFLAAPARADVTLSEAARSVALALGSHPPSVLVVASPLTSDTPAPRADDLSARVASLVAGAVGAEARADAHPLSLGAARARQRSAGAKPPALVYVGVRIHTGHFELTADLYPSVENGWDRLRMPPAPPTAHAFTDVPLSAEVRSYLAPLLLERAAVTKYAGPKGEVLALACGDASGRYGAFVALVTQEDLAWGHLSPSGFVADKVVKSASLASRAPAPLREPLASAALVSYPTGDTLAFAPPGRNAVETRMDLALVRPLGGAPVKDGGDLLCLASTSGRGGWQDQVDCTTGRPTGPTPVWVVDAWSAVDVVSQGGERQRVRALREPSAVLHLSRGDAKSEMKDVGAQVAVADLDQDGVPEVLTTTTNESDALTVSSWKDGAPVTRFVVPAPGGISAIAVCPPDSGGVQAVTMAVGKEIWVVR